jgi:hypothetical protein
MMTFTYPASPGERFDSTAFDSQIGKTIRVNMPDGSAREGVVRGAVVSPDGTSVELTIEVDSHPVNGTEEETP